MSAERLLSTDDLPRRLLTYAEAGEWLGNLPATAVARLVKRGELPSVRVLKKYVRIRPSDLEAYAEQHLEELGQPVAAPPVVLGQLPPMRRKGVSA